MCDVVRVNKYFGVEAFVRSSHRSRLPTIWRTSDGVGGRADRRSAGGALGTGGGAVGGGGGGVRAGEGLGGVVAGERRTRVLVGAVLGGNHGIAPVLRCRDWQPILYVL